MTIFDSVVVADVLKPMVSLSSRLGLSSSVRLLACNLALPLHLPKFWWQHLLAAPGG
jgi:hypothetical protein